MSHRYTLHRNWIGNGSIVNFLMLNPSTADDILDDQTIRKCCGFAKRWGFGGIVVTNLFAYRATKPVDLWSAASANWSHALGERADEAIESAAKSADIVVAAWGAHKKAKPRADAVMSLIVPSIDLYCIGLTSGGFPLHPCMAGYTDAPVVFRAVAA